MKHTAAHELLVDLAMGLLPAAAANEVEAHVASCPACSDEHHRLAAGVAALATVMAAEPGILVPTRPLPEADGDAIERIVAAVEEATRGVGAPDPAAEQAGIDEPDGAGSAPEDGGGPAAQPGGRRGRLRQRDEGPARPPLPGFVPSAGEVEAAPTPGGPHPGGALVRPPSRALDIPGDPFAFLETADTAIPGSAGERRKPRASGAGRGWSITGWLRRQRGQRRLAGAADVEPAAVPAYDDREAWAALAVPAEVEPAGPPVPPAAARPDVGEHEVAAEAVPVEPALDEGAAWAAPDAAAIGPEPPASAGQASSEHEVAAEAVPVEPALADGEVWAAPDAAAMAAEGPAGAGPGADAVLELPVDVPAPPAAASSEAFSGVEAGQGADSAFELAAMARSVAEALAVPEPSPDDASSVAPGEVVPGSEAAPPSSLDAEAAGAGAEPATDGAATPDQAPGAPAAEASGEGSTRGEPTGSGAPTALQPEATAPAGEEEPPLADDTIPVSLEAAPGSGESEGDAPGEAAEPASAPAPAPPDERIAATLARRLRLSSRGKANPVPAHPGGAAGPGPAPANDAPAEGAGAPAPPSHAADDARRPAATVVEIVPAEVVRAPRPQGDARPLTAVERADLERAAERSLFADGAASDAWVPGAGEGRRRGGFLNRMRGRARHGLEGDGADGFDDAYAGIAQSTAPYPGIARPWEVPRRERRHPVDGDDPKAYVSFDEEIRRLSRPNAFLPPGGELPPAYLPGPLEWGLDRYDDPEDAVVPFDDARAEAIASGQLVDSAWRFWAILLGVFSAVLFGIIVYGYLFLRDLNTTTQQLESDVAVSALPLRFAVVTRTENFNTRGEGYYDRQTGRALISLGGLPPIEREQLYVVWAEVDGVAQRVGNASPLGGSSQYVDLRNIPDGVSRIFITVEDLVEGQAPARPAGTVLLEANVE